MKSKTGKAMKVATIVMMLFMATTWSAVVDADDTLHFADYSWDSVQVHNRIAGFIIHHGFGYDVDYIFGDTEPLLLGLRRGDIDIAMEMWVDNILDAYKEALGANEIIDLGSNFPDSPQGWYVPTFVIEGDEDRGIEPVAPDLKSVKDLPDYWELFEEPENPGKGRFYNAPTGWVVHTLNLEKFEAYGLEDTFVAFDPGSDTALATAIVRGYERGEPVLAYYWEPAWVTGLLDLTMLDEPEFDPEVWEETRGCEFPATRVHVAINADLAGRAPELVTFLANYETTLEQTNEALAYMFTEETDVEDAALWFLDNFREVWKEFLYDDDIIERVEQALEEELN